jgi:adenine-specific DNA methylase
VAVLTGLLPYDSELQSPSTAHPAPPVKAEDLEHLTAKERHHLAFYVDLLRKIPPTPLTAEHQRLLLALRIFGDPARFAAQRALAREAAIPLPRAFNQHLSSHHNQSITDDLIVDLSRIWKEAFGLADGEVPVLLDFMAGGGTIPLEGVRYGMKVFASELNPVAATILKATIEYPARFGRRLSPIITAAARDISAKVRERLRRLFPFPPVKEWWPEVENAAHIKFFTKNIRKLEPDKTHEQKKNTYLWCRTVPCSKCGLNIPLSTNFTLDMKGKPATHLAVFPVVPKNGEGRECAFRIVQRNEWKNCKWPRPDFDKWDPRGTPTFRDGKAICPRCGQVMDGDVIKALARSREGGLAAQMYAVCSQVPVKLTYKDGAVKVRYLWRFRVPTPADLAGLKAAEAELARLRSQWQAQDLIPSEDIPEGDKTREPRNIGLVRWRDLFLPRQLLTNVVILEEIRAAQKRAHAELPETEAEAVSVYLSFILSKVVNYNSVNTFWHYGRKTVAQAFSRHDFAFRSAFCEFEGARETVMWGAKQVLSAYEALGGLIHGEEVSVVGGDDEDGEAADDEDDNDDGDMEDGQPSEAVAAASQSRLRPEVIVPTVTCEDAAALSTPAPGTIHLICVDPPYYSNVQYSELSNFFYVWLKRALHDVPGLESFFREPLAEGNREAVANYARFQKEAQIEKENWQARYTAEVQLLRDQGMKAADARWQARENVGPEPPTAKDRADVFYEDKMAAVFRRGRQLLHPAGRMVVMFNHKQTWAWRALGMALIRAGFEIRSSAPIHTEAESSLNIRGLDAARSTVLLLCLPRAEKEQPTGNWSGVQSRIAGTARGAADRFQKQGLAGTDLYLSALGPALGVVGQNWPVTDFAGRSIDLIEALEEAYKAVGAWRLAEIFKELTNKADMQDVTDGFSAEVADRATQTLWLWLDTFQGEIADSDDVRKLAKSLSVDPEDFKRAGLLTVEKDLFILREPMAVDLKNLSRRLKGEEAPRGQAAREADVWEERVFPNFIGAAVWNAIGLMAGQNGSPKGVEAVRRWLRESGYGGQREFRGAFAVTLYLLEKAFGQRKEEDPWQDTARQARRTWDLVLAAGR